MESTTKIILEANPNNLDTSHGAYDVYELATDEFTSFDDLDFVETLPDLPVAWKHNDPTENARWVYDETDAGDIAHEDPSLLAPVQRINEDECTGPDYEAAYKVAS